MAIASSAGASESLPTYIQDAAPADCAACVSGLDKLASGSGTSQRWFRVKIDRKVVIGMSQGNPQPTSLPPVPQFPPRPTWDRDDVTQSQGRSATPPSLQQGPYTNLNIPRRVWELPLAILLWTYIGLGILFFLLLVGGGMATL